MEAIYYLFKENGSYTVKTMITSFSSILSFKNNWLLGDNQYQKFNGISGFIKKKNITDIKLLDAIKEFEKNMFSEIEKSNEEFDLENIIPLSELEPDGEVFAPNLNHKMFDQNRFKK